MAAKGRLVRKAYTAGGWAIGILKEGTEFSVIRISPERRFTTIGRYAELAEARSVADAEWVEQRSVGKRTRN